MPSQKAKPSKASQPSSSGNDIRSFFGSTSQKPSQPAASKPSVIEISDDDEPPKKKASSSKPVPGTSSSAAPTPMDIDTEDKPVAKKRKLAPALLSSDEEDTPPRKKPAASRPKSRLSKLDDDDDFVDSDAPPPKKTSRKSAVMSSDDEDDAPKKKPKAATKSKPRVSKSKKDEEFVVSSSDDEAPPPKKSAAKAKVGPSKPANGKAKEDLPKEKYNWAAAKAAKLAGPVAHGSKAVPDGAPDCLAGLTFVFTGELSSFSREESTDIAKRFGGRVTGQPSSKTSFVVLGDNAGPAKLTAIKKHGLETLDEDGFLQLIATRKGSGKLDEKTVKKMEKEAEAIQTAAKEMEKREKKAAKEAATDKSVEPSSQLWTTRYAPQNIKEICGNKTQVEKLQQWLKDWPASVKCGFKKPGKHGMNVYRAVLITGPPGIGKTTSAHMVAKLEGFTPIELNASDARSKKLVENGMNVNNTSLDAYIAGSRERDGVTITDRTVLIMDEVDGMSSGDRGGVGALNAMIKKSKVPIICIANDRGAQKLKPLVQTTFGLAFQRPQAQMIRSRLMTIAFKEKMTIPANVIDQLVASSQSDIRQVLNMLSTWRLSSDKMNFDEGKALGKMNEKYTIMSPFDITSKMLGPYLFSSTSRETLSEKMEYYFQDHSFMPLFMQENYLKTEPSALRNYDGPEKQLKQLELMDKAASSISDGDLVDALIHGPASHRYGMGAHYGGPNSLSFPQWLGQNSRQTKLSRQLGDVQIRMRLKVSGDKSEIRQSYIPALFPHIVQPLMDVGASAVEEVIEKMDEYYLSKDEWDTIVELGVDEHKDETVLKAIPTATKTALTKNIMLGNIRFHSTRPTDLGKVPRKLAAGPAPDLEEAFEMDEPEESDDEKRSKEDDISKDKLIKQKKKAAPKKAAPKKGKK
ncbi:hypothetical protein FB45DRAFT_1023114 [Roridomyces roridus]|uniref:Replication factor C subunit 1 n=1 Tax=Roridomyces roridus TaxID=1738132 RepID=A0AAD7FU64_9AGAR|nr:hypothetical protein FB45DRAFT_1023114 [Roridomyces roridus]